MLRIPDFYIQFFIIGYLSVTVFGLKCFNCENHVNPACGVYFKPYQFKADHCPGIDYRCALQRQPDKEGWIGIVRICYRLGSLPGINETNGCKTWTNDNNGYTALYCFCDTDYCNSAMTLSINLYIPLLMSLLTTVIHQ